MAKIQPLKWHGGKFYLAPWIIQHFPQHVHYVEPFFGGGAVLFQKPRWSWIEGHSECVNDIHGELINFWKTLQDDYLSEKFRVQIRFEAFAEENFQNSLTIGVDDSPIQRALKFFVRYRQSRQGLGKDFATLSRNRTRSGMNEQISAWLNAVEGLTDAYERLKRVVIFNRDFEEFILSQDGPNTFFYCDPPYLHETRSTTGEYENEMEEDDHIRLLETLTHIQGKFLLSGYESDLYHEFAKAAKWGSTFKMIDNKASSSSEKEFKFEYLWYNW